MDISDAYIDEDVHNGDVYTYDGDVYIEPWDEDWNEYLVVSEPSFPSISFSPYLLSVPW